MYTSTPQYALMAWCSGKSLPYPYLTTYVGLNSLFHKERYGPCICTHSTHRKKLLKVKKF